MEHARVDDHDGGLAADWSRLIGRRRMIGLVGGAGLAALLGCSSGDDAPEAASGTTSGSASTGGAAQRTAAAAATTAGSTAGTAAAESTAAATSAAETTPAPVLDECSTIPEETAGPFPGDGSNGPDVLAESGVVRSDIRSSIGSASGVAEGVPLMVELTVVDSADGCTPRPGAAVYLWHCDREGRYSMYSEGATEENYLRGVQEADANGVMRFTTIFPGCYAGRWPHIHFEMYRSLTDATGGGPIAVTSQLAFPKDVCDATYATAGYEQSVSNLAQLSLDSDMIFADGVEQQLATMTGDPTAGYTATLPITV
jgi:protocatechuate 3,4-dioxygenase beta subunit